MNQTDLMGKRVVIALGGNGPRTARRPGGPFCSYLLGGTEFRLRQGFALRAKRLYAPPGAEGISAPLLSTFLILNEVLFMGKRVVIALGGKRPRTARRPGGPLLFLLARRN